MKRLISLLFTCWSGSVAVGHEQPTHVNITSQALQFLRDSIRPDILKLQGSLRIGAWNEDAFISGYVGRFYFHFKPQLDDFGQYASCDSVAWGLTGSPCTAKTFGNPVVSSLV